MLSVFFFGGLIGCGDDDQLALLYSVFIYSSFTSFWVIQYKSFFGLFIVSSIFASVFNHRPCPKVHSSPVHDFMMRFTQSGRLRQKGTKFIRETKFPVQINMGRSFTKLCAVCVNYCVICYCLNWRAREPSHTSNCIWSRKHQFHLELLLQWNLY